jgi:hypothetical protein
LTILLISSLR